MKRFALFAIAILLAAPAALQAQSQYMELLRSDVRAQKVGILTDAMAMTDDQATKFWPLYREYEVKLAELTDARLANIKAYAEVYGSVTDEQATKLIHAALKNRAARLELQGTYFEKVSEALGATMAARFIQADMFLNTLIDIQIQAALPIVE
jgi:hypothetical protein